MPGLVSADLDRDGCLIISDEFDFADVDEALTKATTPGAADKVVVTFPGAA